MLVSVFVVLRFVQMRSFVHYSGPRVRYPAVLYVSNRFEEPRVQRVRLFHGWQLHVCVFVQYGRYWTNDCCCTSSEKLEYLKRPKDSLRRNDNTFILSLTFFKEGRCKNASIFDYKYTAGNNYVIIEIMLNRRLRGLNVSTR